MLGGGGGDLNNLHSDNNWKTIILPKCKIYEDRRDEEDYSDFIEAGRSLMCIKSPVFLGFCLFPSLNSSTIWNFTLYRGTITFPCHHPRPLVLKNDPFFWSEGPWMIRPLSYFPKWAVTRHRSNSPNVTTAPLLTEFPRCKWQDMK